MRNKFVFLLIVLQLWDFAIPSSSVDDPLQLVESNRTVVNVDVESKYQTNFPIQIGNKFYHVETELHVSWYQAAHNCRKLGGHLLNIESSTEMDLILSAIPSSRYWTSGNCLAEYREWISIATGETMPYLRWQEGEPNNLFGEEFCVEIKISLLNDDDCRLSLNYICEAKTL
ncbi:PREDICTED: C-type lectin 37Db-like [Drosophila arizonae]|uniref:C-type lectin 37Db-like n=1 Tax=Drosophila arizonae TaxID=7263 RepID=A0ABM1NRN2_DROAR|nr:PREDICTED: C-type lectin 37Db-like [Drosophila arizonae]